MTIEDLIEILKSYPPKTIVKVKVGYSPHIEESPDPQLYLSENNEEQLFLN